jgi:hypothetical protein
MEVEASEGMQHLLGSSDPWALRLMEESDPLHVESLSRHPKNGLIKMGAFYFRSGKGCASVSADRTVVAVNAWLCASGAPTTLLCVGVRDRIEVEALDSIVNFISPFHSGIIHHIHIGRDASFAHVGGNDALWTIVLLQAGLLFLGE